MLRFGDQLLTLGRTALAGMTSDAVHCRLDFDQIFPFSPLFQASVWTSEQHCYGGEFLWVIFFTPCFHQEVLSTKVRDRPICRSMVLHKDPAGRSPSPICLEHWVFSLKRHLLGHQS